MPRMIRCATLPKVFDARVCMPDPGKHHVSGEKVNLGTDLKGDNDLLQVVQGKIDELGLFENGAVYVGLADSL